MNRLFSTGKILRLYQALRFWQYASIYNWLFSTLLWMLEIQLNNRVVSLTNPFDETDPVVWSVDLSRWFHHPHPHPHYFWCGMPKRADTFFFFLFLSYYYLWRPVCSFVFFIARFLRNIIETSLQSKTVQFMETAYRHWPSMRGARSSRGVLVVHRLTDPLHLFHFRLLRATHKVVYHQQLQNMPEMANGVAAISVSCSVKVRKGRYLVVFLRWGGSVLLIKNVLRNNQCFCCYAFKGTVHAKRKYLSFRPIHYSFTTHSQVSNVKWLF